MTSKIRKNVRRAQISPKTGINSIAPVPTPINSTNFCP